MTTPFAWLPDRRIHGRLSRWPTYQLFGVSLASDFPFKAQLGPTTNPADLSFTLVREAPFENYDRDDPIYVSRLLTDKGDRAASLYRLKGCLVFDFTEVGAFYLFSHQIVFHLRNPEREHMVETYLLGTVFSLWLESRGIAVLHASAIVLEQGAVGFLAASGGGKSSLTASFLRRGRPLLTDGILPLERRGNQIFGHCGYSQMRLWPREAEHFVGGHLDLEPVLPDHPKLRVPVEASRFGSFHPEGAALARLYLLDRREGGHEVSQPEIVPIAPQEAVIELLKESFAPAIVEALGLQQQRMDFFADLTLSVPVRRLTYPSSLELLPLVCRRVCEDMSASV
jgi:hypothetical protein